MQYKIMNGKKKKFLWAGDTFMLGMNLRQPGFLCSACGLFS